MATKDDILAMMYDIRVDLMDIRKAVEHQRRAPQETSRQTISRTELEHFLREYYGQDADIVFSRCGYTIDIFPKTGTDTTHG